MQTAQVSARTQAGPQSRYEHIDNFLRFLGLLGSAFDPNIYIAAAGLIPFSILRYVDDMLLFSEPTERAYRTSLPYEPSERAYRTAYRTSLPNEPTERPTERPTKRPTDRPIRFTDSDFVGDLDDRCQPPATPSPTGMVPYPGASTNSHSSHSPRRKPNASMHQMRPRGLSGSPRYSLAYSACMPIHKKSLSTTRALFYLRRTQSSTSEPRKLGVRYHFVRDACERNSIRTTYLPTSEMTGDIMTQSLHGRRTGSMRIGWELYDGLQGKHTASGWRLARWIKCFSLEGALFLLLPWFSYGFFTWLRVLMRHPRISCFSFFLCLSFCFQASVRGEVLE